jgi:hypothetical protein
VRFTSHNIEFRIGALSFSGVFVLRVGISLPIVPGGLSAARHSHHFIGTMVAEPLCSLIAIMDPLPFTSSESEESHFTAQDRWESESGNPGQMRQLPGNKKEEIATDGAHASDLAIAVLGEGNDSVLLQAVHQGRTFQIVDAGEHKDFCLWILEAGVCTHNQSNPSIWQAKQHAFRDFGVPHNAWRRATHVA